MPSAREILRAGEWSGCPADSVRLDFDGRQRRRIALTGTHGTAFLLDLPRVMGLQDGDALRLDDGRLVAVVAAPEPLLEVRARDPQHLVRLAWHLGNRHLPTAVEAERLLIRHDHVIAEMLEALGAKVTPVTEPFRPEGGAYGYGTPLGHDHGQADAHGHSHGHARPHHQDHRHAGPAMDEAQLYKLVAWLSPAYPVGAFSYSHGLEWSIEAGEVRDRTDLEAWLGDALALGAGRTDSVLLAAAWQAGKDGDAIGLTEVAELAAAMVPSRERKLETEQQGRAFARTTAAVWPAEALADRPLPYPVAVGWAAGRHGLALQPTLVCYLQAFAANLASAAVRAVPLGQTDGQQVLADLLPLVLEVAAEAESAPLEEIGGATLRIDLASLRHETQYSRLFRS